MLQGTGSSVGKSLLCAALCRIFVRHGLRVAPFKAQNMSNNAFVTMDGGEISRAQAFQAEAAGVPPCVDMNPILLKPVGDLGSQVVLRGRVWGHLRSAEFLTRKPQLWSAVEDSLRTLLDEYDLVVIEGAGSPAEVNLRAADIANMRVARAAEAPVILVGDIDRGGVFASLVGTLDLLEPDERERMAGFIINRFRGDPVLLASGIEFLEQRTGRPVLGVVPHLANPGVAEEDAATLDSACWSQPAEPAAARSGLQRDAAPLEVAAVRLPRLANFDDLDPLQRAGLNVVWVERVGQLRRPDLLVLPGTKNTAADLAWMQESGLSEALIELVDRGAPLLGLCGGYQMMGLSVEDPDGVESDRVSALGLGLLPVSTVLRGAKITRQIRGRLLAARGLFAGVPGGEVKGYEIHAGETDGPGIPLLELYGADGAHLDGRSARSGWIVGTYLHGLLQNRRLTEALIANLRARRAGLPTTAALPDSLDGRRTMEDPYERLADHVEAALDMRRLFGLVGLSSS
jgi:adenosylcobyric acid synthase